MKLSISGYLKKSTTCTQLGYSCTIKLLFYQQFGCLQWLQKYWWKRKWNDISLATAFTQYILKQAKLYFKKNKNKRDFAPWSQVHNLATCNFQFWQLSTLSIFNIFSFGYFQAKFLKRFQEEEEQQQHIDCMDFVIKNSIYILRFHEFHKIKTLKTMYQFTKDAFIFLFCRPICGNNAH